MLVGAVISGISRLSNLQARASEWPVNERTWPIDKVSAGLKNKAFEAEHHIYLFNPPLVELHAAYIWRYSSLYDTLLECAEMLVKGNQP